MQRFASIVADLLLGGFRPAAPLSRCIHNLQHPLGTALRSLIVDSLPLISENVPTFLRNVRATPRTLEQHRFFAVLRREKRRVSSKARRNTDHGNGTSAMVGAEIQLQRWQTAVSTSSGWCFRSCFPAGFWVVFVYQTKQCAL
ncbi:hypothetical protein AVEN_109326-1 [Araneus ventricosus]|uniref:Uncharacterized protein n=1 Tax=Araneus ventricosus TaxID=182803 RepID=A0A4Y2D1G0_ARAVE|nr:hypothetical protein AVEN_109326-1 [Araneus ventricosus]